MPPESPVRHSLVLTITRNQGPDADTFLNLAQGGTTPRNLLNRYI